MDESVADGFLKGAEATAQNFEAAARSEFGERAEAFLSVYTASKPAEIERAAADYAGDRFIGYGTWKLIEAHLETGGVPVYRYRFDHLLPLEEGAPASAKPRAAHSWEIEYVFNTLASKGLPWREEDWELAELMSNYWTNFAKTGDPNGAGLPVWSSYHADSQGAVLHIDAPPEIRFDTHRARYEFLETLLVD